MTIGIMAKPKNWRSQELRRKSVFKLDWIAPQRMIFAACKSGHRLDNRSWVHVLYKAQPAEAIVDDASGSFSFHLGLEVAPGIIQRRYKERVSTVSCTSQRAIIDNAPACILAIH